MIIQTISFTEIYDVVFYSRETAMFGMPPYFAGTFDNENFLGNDRAYNTTSDLLRR